MDIMNTMVEPSPVNGSLVMVAPAERLVDMLAHPLS